MLQKRPDWPCFSFPCPRARQGQRPLNQCLPLSLFGAWEIAKRGALWGLMDRKRDRKRRNNCDTNCHEDTEGRKSDGGHISVSVTLMLPYSEMEVAAHFKGAVTLAHSRLVCRPQRTVAPGLRQCKGSLRTATLASRSSRGAMLDGETHSPSRHYLHVCLFGKNSPGISALTEMFVCNVSCSTLVPSAFFSTLARFYLLG